MLTSKNTNAEVYKIMRKYLAPFQIKKMLEELKGVKGNKSFETSVKGLLDFAKQQSEPAPYPGAGWDN